MQQFQLFCVITSNKANFIQFIPHSPLKSVQINSIWPKNYKSHLEFGLVNGDKNRKYVKISEKYLKDYWNKAQNMCKIKKLLSISHYFVEVGGSLFEFLRNLLGNSAASFDCQGWKMHKHNEIISVSLRKS